METGGDGGGGRFVTAQSNALNCSTREINASELQFSRLFCVAFRFGPY